MQKPIEDLAYRIRANFRRLDLNEPLSVILPTREDGQKLVGMVLHESPLITGTVQPPVPVEHPDGSVWMWIEVAGIKFEWPAVREAQFTGGYVWR